MVFRLCLFATIPYIGSLWKWLSMSLKSMSIFSTRSLSKDRFIFPCFQAESSLKYTSAVPQNLFMSAGVSSVYDNDVNRLFL